MLSLEARGIWNFQAGFASKMQFYRQTMELNWYLQDIVANASWTRTRPEGDCVSLFAPQQLGMHAKHDKSFWILIHLDLFESSKSQSSCRQISLCCHDASCVLRFSFSTSCGSRLCSFKKVQHMLSARHFCFGFLWWFMNNYDDVVFNIHGIAVFPCISSFCLVYFWFGSWPTFQLSRPASTIYRSFTSWQNWVARQHFIGQNRAKADEKPIFPFLCGSIWLGAQVTLKICNNPGGHCSWEWATPKYS